MTIKRYNEKRNFNDTPEPAGKTLPTARAGGLRFVVQKHQASHLHYDFRLELNGVLLSWAVPKGPSLNPGDKRLAMHVEDHPLDYRTFEGTIPEGNYGAGTVMVWDEGTYGADPELSKAANVKQLTADYRKGHLRFVLNGSKLKGAFSLVKMRGGGGKYGNDDKAWLLLKADDAAADRAHPVVDLDRSAVSGRSLEQIAAAQAAVETPRKQTAAQHRKRDFAHAALALGGKSSAVPKIKGPQLATLVDAPFDKDGWVFEIKWDGYRALGYHPQHGRMTLMSRNGLSFDRKFADIVAALDTLPCPAVVDGEVVVLDKQGRSSFARLKQHEQDPADLSYCLFDLLYIDGVDVRDLPLLARKELLKELLQHCDPRLRYSDHVATQGREFFELAKNSQLEGVIAKDGAATYYSARTRHWLKVKVEKRQEFIIAGYTAPRRSRSDIGSLILAYNERKNGKPTGRLRFAGHVGSGIDAATRTLLKQALDKIARKDSPFREKHPTNEAATWVKPELVCEVRFTEKTADCQLRHPVFIALRADKPASEIFWEVSESALKAVAQAQQEDAQEPAAKPRAARAKPKRTGGRRAPAHTLTGASSSPRRPAGTSSPRR